MCRRATRYSVGRWLGDVAAVLDEARREGRPAIVVGGTGLYFKALTEGLAAVPAIPAELRAALREESEGVPTPELHARLAARSTRKTPRRSAPAIAAASCARSRCLPRPAGRSPNGGGRRRAAAGRSGDGASASCSRPTAPNSIRRIAARAGAHAGAGRSAEVEALAALGLDPELPAMKAIGVRELMAHAPATLSLDEALAAIATETRRYAKRQMTWFRNQMADWPRLSDARRLTSPAERT